MLNQSFAKMLSVLLVLLAGAPGCGLNKSKTSSTTDAEMVAVPFGVRFQPTPSLMGGATLSLVDNSLHDFVVEIRSCSSGFEYDVTSTSGTPVSSLNLYKGDTDCVAGLKSFTWDTVAYTKSGGGTLTTGAAIFQNAGNTKRMQAAVYIALETGGIVASSKAHFVIGEIIMGSGYQVPVANYSEPTDVLGNVLEAPNFTIASAFLTAVQTGSGNPVLTVTLDCTGAVVGNTCATPLGVAQDMRQMSVAIVYDNPATYNGTISFTQAETIFGGAKTAIDATMVTNSAGVGATVTGIVGEGPVDDKKNMLVVVQYEETFGATNVHSYRYFNMDLATGMNP